MSCAIAFLVYPSRVPRLPEAAQIGRDHGMPVGKPGDQRQPHMAAFAKTVQQHNGVALPGYEIVQPDAADVSEFALRRLPRVRRGDRNNATASAINTMHAMARPVCGTHCICFLFLQ